MGAEQAGQGGRPDGAGPQGHYARALQFWTDIAHLVSARPQALASVGPMRGFSDAARAVSKELLGAGDDLREFGEALGAYYGQLAATWVGAQRKVDAKAPELPHDAEQLDAYKRVWIDIFDNDFTELFDSREFGENYGRLVSKELDLTRRWERIAGAVLRTAGMPGKQEMDDVYRELHALRRRVSRLEGGGGDAR